MSAQNQPPRLPPCEDCGGAQVAGLQVVSQHHVGLHPRAKTLWANPMLNLDAAVCMNCGRVKLLTFQLDKLRKETAEHPEWFRW